VEVALSCDYPAAQRCVEQLVEAGILEETTGKARNPVFRGSQIIAAIDEPTEIPERNAPTTNSWGAFKVHGLGVEVAAIFIKTRKSTPLG